MSNLTAAINVQVDSKDKEEATKILQKLGVSMSGLINMTLKQVILRGGIPFDVTTNIKVNKEIKAMKKELEYIEQHLDEYVKYNNSEDLKSSLLSDG